MFLAIVYLVRCLPLPSGGVSQASNEGLTIWCNACGVLFQNLV